MWNIYLESDEKSFQKWLYLRKIYNSQCIRDNMVKNVQYQYKYSNIKMHSVTT